MPRPGTPPFLWRGRRLVVRADQHAARGAEAGASVGLHAAPFFHHITRSFCDQVPGLDQVLRANPGLATDLSAAAAGVMSNNDPSGAVGGLMSMFSAFMPSAGGEGAGGGGGFTSGASQLPFEGAGAAGPAPPQRTMRAAVGLTEASKRFAAAPAGGRDERMSLGSLDSGELAEVEHISSEAVAANRREGGRKPAKPSPRPEPLKILL
jgi:hypothetical protein